MVDLSVSAIISWRRCLPKDVSSVLETEEGVAPAASELIAGFSPLDDPEEVLSLMISADPEKIAVLGRSRRIRLLSWVVSQAVQAGEDPAEVIDVLTGEDEEGEQGQGSLGGARILFLEDIKAISAVVGVRLARKIASPEAMNEALNAAMTAENEVSYPHGGVP